MSLDVPGRRPRKIATEGRRKRQRGQAILELGLCMTAFFLMIFGIFEYSQVAYANNFCAYAAQQAARYASIHGAASAAPLTTSPSPCGTSCSNPSSGDSTTAYIKSLAVGLVASRLTVTTTWTANSGNGNAAGGVVTVNVKYAYNPLLSIFFSNTLNLNSTATMQVLQ